ncbi:radical SAM protein [Candidatus Woesearchaeota archaeon]|nr:radical SAM protein [Candidatus Woesearchaeota archaeon]
MKSKAEIEEYFKSRYEFSSDGLKQFDSILLLLSSYEPNGKNHQIEFVLQEGKLKILSLFFPDEFSSKRIEQCREALMKFTTTQNTSDYIFPEHAIYCPIQMAWEFNNGSFSKFKIYYSNKPGNDIGKIDVIINKLLVNLGMPTSIKNLDLVGEEYDCIGIDFCKNHETSLKLYTRFSKPYSANMILDILDRNSMGKHISFDAFSEFINRNDYTSWGFQYKLDKNCNISSLKCWYRTSDKPYYDSNSYISYVCMNNQVIEYYLRFNPYGEVLDIQGIISSPINHIRRALLGLTNKCNLRCDYCYVDLNNNSLSQGDIKMMVDIMSKSVVQDERLLYLYGGEPFENMANVYYAIDLADSKGIRSIIVTNGTILSEEILGFISKYKLKVMISLSGPKDTHDKHRFYPNKSGSYDKIITNIKKLRSIMPEDDLWISYTVVPEDALNILRNVKNWFDLGITNFHIEPVLHTDFDWKPYASLFEEQYLEFLEFISAMKDKGILIGHSILIRQMEVLLGLPSSYKEYNDLRIYPSTSIISDHFTNSSMNISGKNSDQGLWRFMRDMAKEYGRKFLTSKEFKEYMRKGI